MMMTLIRYQKFKLILLLLKKSSISDEIPKTHKYSPMESENEANLPKTIEKKKPQSIMFTGVEDIVGLTTELS